MTTRKAEGVGDVWSELDAIARRIEIEAMKVCIFGRVKITAQTKQQSSVVVETGWQRPYKGFPFRDTRQK
jgi:hypothetical protein